MKKTKRIKDKRTYIFDVGDTVISKFKTYTVDPGFNPVKPQLISKIKDIIEYHGLSGIVYQVLWFELAPDKMQLGELFLPYDKETKERVKIRIKEAEQMSGGEFKESSKIENKQLSMNDTLRNQLKNVKK